MLSEQSQPIDMDDIMNSLKTTIDNTSDITGNLSKITTNIESGNGTIGRLMMDKTWRENFDSTIINLKGGSAGFRALMDKSNDVDEILVSLKSTMENTSNITRDLATIVGNIQSGEGALGKLLMDKSAAQNVDSTFINLKNGTAGLKILMERAKYSWLLWGWDQ